MSDLWNPELFQGATRVDAWARPATGGGFTPWTESRNLGRRAADRGFVPTDRRAPQQPVAAPEPAEPEIDVEQLVADAFARGFEEARQTIAMQYAAERQALADLMNAVETLRPEGPGPLAAVLAETVSRMVKQVVGEVEMNVDLLHERALTVAELVSAESGPSRLRLHPDDIARLEGMDLPLPMAADHHLEPGTIVLESGEGWIEDGPEVRLARLRAQLDNMGLPR